MKTCSSQLKNYSWKLVLTSFVNYCNTVPGHAEAGRLRVVECTHNQVCRHAGEEGMSSEAERQTRLSGDAGPLSPQSFHGCQMVFEGRRRQELRGTDPRRQGCTEAGFGPCSSGTASCWPSSLWPHAH